MTRTNRISVALVALLVVLAGTTTVVLAGAGDVSSAENTNSLVSGDETEMTTETAAEETETEGEPEETETEGEPEETTAEGAAAEEDANVTFENQTSNGSAVVVASVTVPEGGFVTIHDSALLDGDALGSVVGTSEYLEAGTYENVTVELNETLEDSEVLIAMPHMDTNENQEYDFVTSEGEEDGPYVNATGDIVIDAAFVNLEGTGEAGPVVDENETETETETPEEAEETETVAETEEETTTEAEPETETETPVEETEEAETTEETETTEEAETTEEEVETTEEPVEPERPAAPAENVVPVHFDDVSIDNISFSIGQGEPQRTITISDVSVEDRTVRINVSKLLTGASEGQYGTADEERRAVEDEVDAAAHHRYGSLQVQIENVHLENVTVEFVVSDGLRHQAVEMYEQMTPDGAEMEQGEAEVTFENQTTDGSTVEVDSVTLSEGGFVTIHDSSLLEGDALGSVVGTSEYLEPGTHEDVTVTLDEPLTESAVLIAMPHMDTNENQEYDFVTSEGEEDGPYVDESGRPVVAPGLVTVETEPVEETTEEDETTTETAETTTEAEETTTEAEETTTEAEETTTEAEETTTEAEPETETETEAEDGAIAEATNVTFQNQTSNGSAVVVESVTLSEGGFVTIHDSSLLEGEVFDSVVGTSEYLEPGTYENVTVELNETLTESALLVAMPHMDTNENQEYDFVTSEGEEDGPYVDDSGTPIVDIAVVTVEGAPAEATTTPAENETTTEVEVTTTEAPATDEAETTTEMPAEETATETEEPAAETETETPEVETGTGGEAEGGAAENATSVTFENQTSNGSVVMVESVTLSEGGFVTIHDSTLLDGDALGSVVGTSEYLEAGTHENVTVELNETLTESAVLIAMPHMDTNENQEYDFVTSEGEEDGPYVDESEAPIVDPANVTVEEDDGCACGLDTPNRSPAVAFG